MILTIIGVIFLIRKIQKGPKQEAIIVQMKARERFLDYNILENKS
jgi:hypothetical protein